MESHLADGNPGPAPSTAPASRPTFEYAPAAVPTPPAPASAPRQPGTEQDTSPVNRFLNEVPKTEAPDNKVAVTSMYAGSGSYTKPAAAPSSAEETETDGLDRTQLAKLRRVARQRARNGVSTHRINEWLIKEGMSESQAAQVVTIASREAESSRMAAAAANRKDMTLAWIEIIGGIVLLIAGLAAGWFVGLFLVPIIDGFRRLGS